MTVQICRGLLFFEQIRGVTMFAEMTMPISGPFDPRRHLRPGRLRYPSCELVKLKLVARHTAQKPDRNFVAFVPAGARPEFTRRKFGLRSRDRRHRTSEFVGERRLANSHDAKADGVLAEKRIIRQGVEQKFRGAAEFFFPAHFLAPLHAEFRQRFSFGLVAVATSLVAHAGSQLRDLEVLGVSFNLPLTRPSLKRMRCVVSCG